MGKDGQDLAADVARNPGIVGAVVVALDESGKLLMGASLADLEPVKDIMVPIAKAISDHVDRRWPKNKPVDASGVFARDEDLS